MLRQASHVVGWPKLKCSLPVAVTAQPRSMRVSVTAAPIPLVPPITRARFVLTLPLIARLQDSLGYPGGTVPVDRGRVREESPAERDQRELRHVLGVHEPPIDRQSQ